MEEDDKTRLITKFLSGSLTEEEKKVFARSVEADSNFERKVQFEVNLQQSLREKHRNELIEKANQADQSKAETRNKTIFLGLLGLLFLGIFIFLTLQPRYQSILEEEYRKNKMKEIIEQGIESRHFGPIAGEPNNWKPVLANGLVSPGSIDSSYQIFESLMVSNPPCSDIMINFYAASIALYRYENYDRAAKLYACISSSEGPDFKAESQLPLLFIELAAGENDAARTRWELNNFPLDTLPENMREIFKK